MNESLGVLATWHAHLPSAAANAQAWEAAVARLHADGEHMYFEYLYVVPVLRAIGDTERVRRVLSGAGLSWYTASDMWTDYPRYEAGSAPAA